VGINLSLSFSKYNTFEKCPLKYIQNYILKPVLPEEPASYPLVLGTLTHLFINLYHEYNLTLKEIHKIKDDLDLLYKYITLVYLSYDFKTGKFASLSMDVTKKTEETIKFIKENEVVFFQAYKLFKSYINELLPKFNQANIVSEFTFNNVYKFGDDVICMYGSIDLIFWIIKKYLYISDFKTGKSIDKHAISQLYFYYYNIYNYNFENDIVNNPDNIDKIRELNNILRESIQTFGIVFKVRDLTNEKILISNDNKDYNTFIEGVYNNLTNEIIPLHKNKDEIAKDDTLLIYKEKYINMGYINKEECLQKDESYVCKYCKFKELCKYRIRG
jgi:hypothetical protein